MELKQISNEIKDIIDKKRDEFNLSFIEEEHVYYMKDVDGIIKNNFPSVSKVVKKFYRSFDAEGMSLKMSNGDPEGALKLREQWKRAGDLSTNLGSRVHFELEKKLIDKHGSYKNIRQPIFEIDDNQRTKSDMMINAGEEFINLMIDRGAILLDTEIVLGHPEEEYTGQPDKVWLIQNKNKDGFGFVITDWKTNQPKNFEVQHYTGRMYSPFQNYHDTALSHYYLQLPLYGRLLIKMLEGTKYENLKLLGSIVVLLKEDGTFSEYRVPQEVNQKIMNLDLKKYIKR
jgi:hypothetical protein